jgi:hypothetical protein
MYENILNPSIPYAASTPTILLTIPGFGIIALSIAT